MSQGRIFMDVLLERGRQRTLWGDQHHTASRWGLILGEEFGEAIAEANEVEFRGADLARLRTELVEVAAVAVAWIEDLDGRTA